jgi:hypothetical protein
MSINEIQTKLDNLNNLLTERDLLLIEYFRSTSKVSMDEREKAQRNILNKYNLKFEKEVNIEDKYHDLDESMTLLIQYKIKLELILHYYHLGV